MTSNVGHGLNHLNKMAFAKNFPRNSLSKTVGPLRFVEIFAAVVLLVGGTFELSGDSEKIPEVRIHSCGCPGDGS